MTGPRLRVEDLLAIEDFAGHLDERKLQLNFLRVEIVYLVTWYGWGLLKRFRCIIRCVSGRQVLRG